MATPTAMDACNYCGAPGALKCGRCHAACYCSRDHQRLDSGDHRDLCKNYTSVSSPDLGEHLAATCLILPGNLIFSENPILVGPVAYSDLICLGCHSAITEEDFSKCPDCKWPVCSKVCANSKSHWAECDVLAKDELGIGIPQHIGQTPRYDLIMLLRGLLLKETDPKSWKVLMAMQSHKEIWKKDNDPFHAAAVKYFTEVCKCGFDEDEIHHVRGVIMTNCMVFKSDKGTSLRALYPQFRLFNHSCIPNIHISSNSDGEITARAAVTIQKNEQLCISYTGTMEPLWQRQKYLSEIYKFQCQCKRCSDPTEFGTYFSSPRCPDCRRSFMLPSGNGSINWWICETCGLRYELIDVLQEVSDWLNRIDMSDFIGKRTVKQLNKDVDRMHDSFHPLHYVPLQFTQNLLREIKGENYVTFKLRQEIWENHLEICDKLEPGLTRRRGRSKFLK
ncbi:SET domain-containing protein SmydA-8 isoform X2 [Hyalella azteca]|uniref:SET domain-containing protein SmydA-8 isoform X2 n=1 Tax=Hyalella azteca TaxID=294128 RepID=A0A8B7PFL8_HYAAZ|nr:SET domain-containing protein SmydA-8 isoform X2 [Hyalella azteca]